MKDYSPQVDYVINGETVFYYLENPELGDLKVGELPEDLFRYRREIAKLLNAAVEAVVEDYKRCMEASGLES
ncbi:hypothetical protein [Picosynechococcus sp. NKBG042902]|uniref:hypothetical protein n=1 Tax=Picosynechococcus sp. NKBG042902 TaxID=490193 RepID=UPI0004AA0DD5|nr:hypothetical protein [Picosynechococcus sp. NKBG042902]